MVARAARRGEVNPERFRERCIAERALSMRSMVTINLRNETHGKQDFYLFQQPAIYTGGGVVYSKCLGSVALDSYYSTGLIYTFQVERQYYAGTEGTFAGTVGAAGFGLVCRAIELTPHEDADAVSKNWTTATVRPIALSEPTNGEGVRPGAFRISTPSFDEGLLYNAGSVVKIFDGDSKTVLSNFVKAEPLANFDVQPVLKFYVQTGHSFSGEALDFSRSSKEAALIDFTGGHDTCEVTLSWSGWRAELR